jgi:quercetin dioxygenase-like cupin family protein
MPIHLLSVTKVPALFLSAKYICKETNAKELQMNYTFLANLQQEFTLPEKGILSRILHKDEKVNVTLFGFAAGEELSAHSAPTPAILYFLEGDAELQLGEDKVSAQPGSFVYMPPMLPHGILAKTALRVLLVQMKNPAL